ncbi:CsbD family protein [Uniformispora flossi]|uniref:CsbD family protein n=1 Tax=Uniformispora flossi TaxID=3390723 RepID=UPI003C2B4BD6
MSDSGAMDKLKGKAKEVAGKVTGDRRQESEGRTDQAKGKAKDAVDGLQDRARGVRDSLSRDRNEP